jgi:flavin reductase (DIM6/NTAB) family NADH-FMN oxidoreductase RutF
MSTDPMIARMCADVDQRALRQVFGCFPSGVTAVCGLHGGLPAGIVVSSFTPVSLDPPLVGLCVQNSSTTWPKLRELRRLGVSVLNEEHGGLCRQLSSKAGDRFAGVELTTSADGAVFVPAATMWLDCAVEREVQAGDHIMVLLRIHRHLADPGAAPLVFHGSRFRQLAGAGVPLDRGE